MEPRPKTQNPWKIGSNAQDAAHSAAPVEPPGHGSPLSVPIALAFSLLASGSRTTPKTGELHSNLIWFYE
jgi:hypothetical protein